MDGTAPSWEFAATGTRWRIYHSGLLTARAAGILAAAVEGDEARWSRFRAASEVSALNRHAGSWQEVSPETVELLGACAEWTERTGGIFQPLVGAALSASGYDRSLAERAPYTATTPRPAPLTARITLDAAAGRALIPAGAALDLGGIGKSWIAGRLAVRARHLSPDPAILIDAGGDLVAAAGAHLVGVEDGAAGGPGEDAGAGVRLCLRAGDAVATSGYRHRRWTNGDGRERHHLIDPRTGESGPLTQATVLAGDAVTADVTAKVLALCPELLAACPHPARLITPEGTTVNAPWRAAAGSEDHAPGTTHISLTDE